MRVTRYPRIRERLEPALAGRLINELRDLAILVKSLPVVTVSPILTTTTCWRRPPPVRRTFFVTGDKRDILPLGRYAGAKIVTVRQFLILSRRLP